MMKKLQVKYACDNQRMHDVGQLAELNNRIFFEYERSFMDLHIELSPFFLPLKQGLVEHTDRSFGPIWGVFDDSLPDGWGLLLMERYYRKQGLSLHAMSPLDRLGWLGVRTMGALTYHPSVESEEWCGRVLDLRKLAEHSMKILNGEESEVLPQLLAVGGSPGGARPKVLIGYDPRNKTVLSGESNLPDGYEHWMVKFRSKEDPLDGAAIEYAYSLMARSAGITMPETRLFSGGRSARYFGIKRFDRGKGNQRYHIHTFGNLVHADFRIPSVDYCELMKVTAVMTRDHHAVEEMFRRMVFNVFAHNRDDHVKNFSFILDLERGTWQVSPAYDLIFTEGPSGEHSMSVNGNGKEPGVRDILSVAEKSAVEKGVALRIIDEVAASIGDWSRFAAEAGVSERSMKAIAKKLLR